MDTDAANTANTALIYHGKRFLALMEAARPVQVNAGNLDSIGTYTFDGKLKHNVTGTSIYLIVSTMTLNLRSKSTSESGSGHRRNDFLRLPCRSWARHGQIQRRYQVSSVELSST